MSAEPRPTAGPEAAAGGAEAAEAQKAMAAAKAAFSRQFGHPPEKLEAASGGLSNHVFEVAGADAEVVIRLGLADDGKSEGFARERRVIDRVSRAGVPAPEVVAVGEVDGFAFMITRRAPGTIGANAPRRLRTLKDLGALAAQRVHTIRTSGFGRDFGFEAGAGGTVGWRDWLLAEKRALASLDLLRKQAVISERRFAALRDTLDSVAGWTDEPVLNHGDLRLKNVVVDGDGAIVALIDWEASVSAPGPHWDLSLALHDLWVDQMQAFLDGYGLTQAQVRSAAPAWRLFNALNYAPRVERALAAADHDALEHIRTRFSGALDLFGGMDVR